MILQHNRPETEHSLLSKIAHAIAAFWLFGMAALVLAAFYDFLVIYHAAILHVIYIAFKCLLVCTCFYAVSVGYMAIESKSIKNQMSQFNPDSIEYDEEPSEEQKIIDSYNEMSGDDDFSMNRLALRIYGKRGGAYNKKIRAVLHDDGIEI